MAAPDPLGKLPLVDSAFGPIVIQILSLDAKDLHWTNIHLWANAGYQLSILFVDMIFLDMLR